jgi:hypothetical protein
MTPVRSAWTVCYVMAKKKPSNIGHIIGKGTSGPRRFTIAYLLRVNFCDPPAKII